ncbi:MAG: fatty acid--CoA ligase family protein [Caulobacteraceae bacterium]|nr:fatty acid--CoA ligase family protein [Caulobacteraceae bacterium]
MALIGSIVSHARTAPGRTAVVNNGQTYSYRAFAGLIAGARAVLARQSPPTDRVAVLCVDAPFDAWIIGIALRSLGVTTVNARSVEDIGRLNLGPVSVVWGEAGPWPGLAAEAERAGCSSLAVSQADCLGGVQALASSLPEPPDDAGGGHILLTSGTTGVYKKILASAAQEARNVASRAEPFGLNAASVVNVFDFGGWTGIGYRYPVAVWTVGGAVVIDQSVDGRRSFRPQELTHAFVQPQLLAELLATPTEGAQRNDAMMLAFGGGVLSVAHWRAARERFTDAVCTTIGATEIGNLTLTRIESPEDLPWHRVCEGIEVQIVDDNDQPLPAGQTGVVRMRTTGVEGYLGDPQTSAAFFRGGFFYPGDLGVLREDGRLSLQGRVTDVINVGGDKIATTPIETLIQDRLGAEAVCVFSVPGQDGEAVHVAIQPGRPIKPAELKAALVEALAGLAEQVQAHQVAAFPRNHMGKIERAALKQRLLG